MIAKLTLITLALLLRPLPYPNADRLVALSENSLEAADISVPYPDYLDWVTARLKSRGGRRKSIRW